MRWIGLVLVCAYTTASADAQLATDAPPPKAQLASGCTRVTKLIGQDPVELAGVMKQHALEEITLEMIILPPNSGATNAHDIITVKVGGKSVRGLYSRLSGDGCMRPDHRFAVDADGKIYQFDGPAGVVDYSASTCHTARGWVKCNLAGQTDVLYIVRDPKVRLGGYFGSSLGFFAP